jgi:hypothetical protein
VFHRNGGEENIDSGCVFDSRVLVQKGSRPMKQWAREARKKLKCLVRFSHFSAEKLEKSKKQTCSFVAFEKPEGVLLCGFRKAGRCPSHQQVFKYTKNHY